MFKCNISTGVTLRNLELNDSEKLFTLIKNNQKYFSETIGFIKKIENLQYVKEFIKIGLKHYNSGKGFFTGIWQNQKLIGVLIVEKIDNNNLSVELGCWLDPKFQKQGIMIKVGEEIIQYLFKIRKLNRIEIRTITTNINAIILVEKLGFQKEGLLRQVEKRDNGYYDHYIYSLLAV